MAIQDIVDRIAADATEEADAIVAAARAEAGELLATARARADAERARVLERARAEAERDAGTRVAAARLGARDAALRARIAQASEALDAAVAAVTALPDARYAEFLARAAAAASNGSERVWLGSADAARLRATLPAALSAAGVTLEIAGEATDLAHGIALVAPGSRVEVSPHAMVADRREELLGLADRVLSGREE